MNGLQIHMRVRLEVFSQLGNKHIHASAQEIIVLAPYIQQYLFSLQDAIGVFAKEFKQVGLLLSEVEYFFVDGELEVGVGEPEVADGEEYGLVGVHFTGPAEKYFHTHQQLLDAEGLGDIVVGATLKSLDLVFFHGLGREEKNGYDVALLPDLFGDGKSVLIGHHDIQQANAELIFIELVDRGLSIRAQHHIIACIDEIILYYISKGKVVFSQQHFYFRGLLHNFLIERNK